MTFTPRRDRPAPLSGAIHLLSDTHFGIAAMTSDRKQVLADDLAYLRRTGLTVSAHVVIGDITNDAGGSGGWTGPAPYIGVQDTEAVNYFTANMNDAPWYFAVGNHDIGNDASGSLRPPDRTAHSLGLPGDVANYVVDLDAMRLIFTCPDGGLNGDGSMVPFTSTRLDWIAARAAESTRPCAVVCHWNLQNTVTDSTSFQNYCSPPSSVAAMLAASPNIKAWLSGHTHRSMDNNIAVSATFGSHKIACIDASAIAYTTPEGSTDHFTRVCSLYLNVRAGDRIEVRYRDHGAGAWVPAGPNLNEQQRVYTFPI